MRKLFAVSFALLFMAAIPAHATIWYVSATTGSDTKSGTRASAPFKTIGAAVARLANNDQVRIALGTYNEALTITSRDGILFSGGYNTTFTTCNPKTNVTVVSGNYTLPVFTFSASRLCTLKGLTVKSGTYNVTVGDNQSAIVNLTIDNCTLTDCAAGYRAVYFSGAWVVTQKSRIVNNGGDGIVGLSPYEITRGDVFDCEISQNNGTGVYFVFNPPGRIFNTVIVGNAGTGIWKAYPSMTMLVYNNVIMQNAAGGVGAGYYAMMDLRNNVIADNGGPGIIQSSGTVVGSDFNDVIGNIGGDYSQLLPGANDLSVDPDLDATWHLNRTSPLIDRGTDLSAYFTTDAAGNPRAASVGGDGLYDIGAFEITDHDTDGWTILQGDCNDYDATIHPGAVEVVKDGIDQDCNGYDLTIVVTKAVWSSAKKSLTVEATSNLGAAAALKVTGYTAMTWNATSQKWTLIANARTKPASVTVTGIEGAVKATVIAQ